jgi:hypothetical protein
VEARRKKCKGIFTVACFILITGIYNDKSRKKWISLCKISRFGKACYLAIFVARTERQVENSTV